MLQSMTAFMSHSFNLTGYTLSWDIRSVNHRYLDLNIKLPESLLMLEVDVRNKLKSQLGRGKVECALKVKFDQTEDAATFNLNQPMVKGLLAATQQLEAVDPERVDGRLRSMDLLRWPGVVATDSEDLFTHKAAILAALDEAVARFIEQRQQEGAALGEFILGKLGGLTEAIGAIESQYGTLLAYQEQKLRSRIEELKDVSVDNNRLEQELVYLMQRLDIEEELSRLKTHVAKVTDTVQGVKKEAAVGKMLDFYMQELNREANTICSKSQNAQITQEGVDLKMFIEQMREQVQNIQ